MNTADFILDLIQLAVMGLLLFQLYGPKAGHKAQGRQQILADLKADPKRAAQIAAYMAENPSASYRKAAIAVQDSEK